MKVKGKTQYWVDIAIAVGFVLSAVSGIVLYFAPSAGFMGGRNPGYARQVLFLGHDVWKSIHNWSSFVMAGGVFLHLVLHWDWIVCMTRNLAKRASKRKAVKVCETNA
jgi:cytochrome b subunit of formate dehydrogenase